MVKEIESTVYVTSNGEKFVDKEKANNREIILEALRMHEDGIMQFTLGA